MEIIRLLQQMCQVKGCAIYNSSYYFSKGGSKIICTKITLINPVPCELYILPSLWPPQDNEAAPKFKAANHYFYPQQKVKPSTIISVYTLWHKDLGLWEPIKCVPQRHSALRYYLPYSNNNVFTIDCVRILHGSIHWNLPIILWGKYFPHF